MGQYFNYVSFARLFGDCFTRWGTPVRSNFTYGDGWAVTSYSNNIGLVDVLGASIITNASAEQRFNSPSVLPEIVSISQEPAFDQVGNPRDVIQIVLRDVDI